MKEYFYEAKVRPKFNPSTTTEPKSLLNLILDDNRCTRVRWQESKIITISRNNVQTKTIRAKND